jgi:hypothetical protein
MQFNIDTSYRSRYQLNKSKLKTERYYLILIKIKNTVLGPSWSHGSWIYKYLPPLTLRVRTPLMARCIWYNIIWSSLSVTCGRSMIFFNLITRNPWFCNFCGSRNHLFCRKLTPLSTIFQLHRGWFFSCIGGRNQKNDGCHIWSRNCQPFRYTWVVLTGLWCSIFCYLCNIL